MKPLNLDNSPCTAISSNCVIWQGPNLDCIKLCTGDTLSDVVAKLASELCLIMDQLKVSNYDLSCFNLVNCKPDTFEALLQFLIEQICALNNIQNTQSSAPDTTKSSTLVSVAPCFIVNGVTVMPLSDYVIAIGNKICSLIDQISFINTQIDNILIRIEALENAPTPSFTIPSFTLNCQIGSITGNQYINIILQQFINNVWCDFYAITGTTSELSTAVQSICIADTDLQLTTGTPFSTNPNWIQSTNYDTVADAINNLWIALCDTYNYLDTYTPPTSVVTAGTWTSVTTSTVGTVTTYQVSESPKPGLSVYLSPAANLNKTAPGLNTGRLCDGSIQVMTSIEYNDFGSAYDTTTGIFTIPTDGVYDIGFFVSYSRDSGTGWYDAGTPGMFIAGITSPTSCNYYCINNFSPVVIEKHASINGSFTRNFTAGTQICLKVINLTNYNYTSESGDVVRFSVQRVK